MGKKILATAAFFGMTAVILGAFGAHALKKVLDAAQQASFETGVRYQFYHALLLLFLGNAGGLRERRRRLCAIFTCVGIILFSGSIYLLSTGPAMGIDFRPIGFVTPIGGLLLIIAWLMLFIEYVSKKS